MSFFYDLSPSIASRSTFNYFTNLTDFAVVVVLVFLLSSWKSESTDARDHSMHGESCVVDIGELGKIIESPENERRLIVVGKTSARTLESLYWIGVKMLTNSFEGCEKDDSSSTFELGQNEWSHLAKTNVDNISAANAL